MIPFNTHQLIIEHIRDQSTLDTYYNVFQNDIPTDFYHQKRQMIAPLIIIPSSHQIIQWNLSTQNISPIITIEHPINNIFFSHKHNILCVTTQHTSSKYTQHVYVYRFPSFENLGVVTVKCDMIDTVKIGECLMQSGGICVAVGCLSGVVYVYDVLNMSQCCYRLENMPECRISGLQVPSSCLDFHPLKPWLACYGMYRDIVIWDYWTGKKVMEIPTEGVMGRALVFHPNGRSLLVENATAPGRSFFKFTLRQYNLETHKWCPLTIQSPVMGIYDIHSHHDHIRSFHFDPHDTSKLWVHHSQGSIYSVQLPTGPIIPNTLIPTQHIQHLSYSNTEKSFIYLQRNNDTQIQLLRTSDHNIITHISYPHDILPFQNIITIGI